MAHRNYFRQNNLRILKWQHIQRLKITILGANWQVFRLESIAKCSYFILSTQNIKSYWLVMKIKKFLLLIWWYNRGLFPLGNKYLGSSFWMGWFGICSRVKTLLETSCETTWKTTLILKWFNPLDLTQSRALTLFSSLLMCMP